MGLYIKLFFTFILTINTTLVSQSISGKLIDENGSGLAYVNLTIFMSSGIYYTSSNHDGTFTFIVTDVNDDVLPTDFNVSNNFPNPFNPVTRIVISSTKNSNVNVEVFNILGQIMWERIEENLSAGITTLDIELDGLPNGIYIARVSFNEKYSVTRKLMLLYGSPHLTDREFNYNNSVLNKTVTLQKTNIDSIVATNKIIGRKKITNLPYYIGNQLDLGNLIICRYCSEIPIVEYLGKTYNTIEIGDQCWLKENLNVGTTVISNNILDDQKNNGIIEKYCYENDSVNCNKFGGLYQWNEAMQYNTQEGAQGICPPGWHIPTQQDYLKLRTILEGDGNALKGIGQGMGDGSGSNSSGFSAYITGLRWYSGGFLGLDYNTSYWSSTSEPNYGESLTMTLYQENDFIGISYLARMYGACIRCIKD